MWTNFISVERKEIHVCERYVQWFRLVFISQVLFVNIRKKQITFPYFLEDMLFHVMAHKHNFVYVVICDKLQQYPAVGWSFHPKDTFPSDNWESMFFHSSSRERAIIISASAYFHTFRHSDIKRFETFASSFCIVRWGYFWTFSCCNLSSYITNRHYLAYCAGVWGKNVRYFTFNNSLFRAESVT